MGILFLVKTNNLIGKVCTDCGKPAKYEGIITDNYYCEDCLNEC